MSRAWETPARKGLCGLQVQRAFLVPAYSIIWAFHRYVFTHCFYHLKKNNNTIFKPFQMESNTDYANRHFQTTLTMPAAVSHFLNFIRP